MTRRKIVKLKNSMKFVKEKCICCKGLGSYFYMPGTEVYCYSCVPKGCSCNNEYFDTLEEVRDFTSKLHKHNESFYIEDYKSKAKVCGEGEVIKDLKEIDKRLLQGNIDHLIFIPLNEKGNEYPCCEYFCD